MLWKVWIMNKPVSEQVLFITNCCTYSFSEKKKSLTAEILLTFAQFVPATRQDTSPPSLPAAVMALRVMGVNLSLLCSATTKVLWNLWMRPVCWKIQINHHVWPQAVNEQSWQVGRRSGAVSSTIPVWYSNTTYIHNISDSKYWARKKSLKI